MQAEKDVLPPADVFPVQVREIMRVEEEPPTGDGDDDGDSLQERLVRMLPRKFTAIVVRIDPPIGRKRAIIAPVK